MAIISKETFDKFTEEEKKKLNEVYSSTNSNSYFNQGIRSSFKLIFGKENLQPKIRTWTDVEKFNKIFSDTNIFFTHPNINWIWGQKVVDKCIATLKIAKLIELGYGGIVTDEEWKDYRVHKYCVVLDINGKFSIECRKGNTHEFIAFHTLQQAEEFMFYPENRKLFEQYNMV